MTRPPLDSKLEVPAPAKPKSSRLPTSGPRLELRTIVYTRLVRHLTTILNSDHRHPRAFIGSRAASMHAVSAGNSVLGFQQSHCSLFEHCACVLAVAGRLLSVAFIGSNIATGALFVVQTECLVPCACSTPAFHDCPSFSRLEIMSEIMRLGHMPFLRIRLLLPCPYSLALVVLVYLVSHPRPESEPLLSIVTSH